MMTLRRARIATLATLAVAALAGCGGGGGETAATTPTPPVTPAALTLTGTAATGRAVAGGAILAKCASGNGSATTLADGSYSVSVSGGALPCVVKVTAVDGTVLHSVAEGSGSSAVANITPITELIVAQASGGSAATVFSSFDAAAQAKLSAAALTTATTAVITALQGVVNLSGVNPLKDVLVAATGSAAGNALDQKLDTLVAALAAAKVTVAELSTAIVNNGAAAAVVVAAQVQPAAAHCSSLRSGDYMVLNPNETLADYRVRKISIDATTLKIRLADGSAAGTGVAVAGRPCEFSNEDGSARWVVSPAGVIVQRYIAQDGSNLARVAVAIPVQALTLADLAGNWNTLEFDRDSSSSGFANGSSTVTVDAGGRITAGADCQQLAACTAWTSVPTGFATHADGGFSATDRNGAVGRFFAFRATSGDMVFFGLLADGVLVASKQRVLPLPEVGAVTPFWDVSVNSSGVASSLVFETSTIASVDSVAGSYTRTVGSTGGVQTFALNNPRDGLRYRVLNSCKTSAGAATNCSGLIGMPLTGMGMVVYSSAESSAQFFGISVNRPAGSTDTGVSISGGSTSSTGSAGSTGSTATLGTLVVTGGEIYPLRANLTVNAAGQINGGGYDFHKLDGTMTACTYSTANAATCHGSSGNFSTTSQNGTISTAGASGVSLTAGPDIYGYTFVGTLSGTTWSGTWTKVATASSTFTGSGSFSVALGITVSN